MGRSTHGQRMAGKVVGGLFDLSGKALVGLIKLLLKLGYWGVKKAVTHPRTSAAFSFIGGAVLLVGWEIVVGLVGLLLIAASTWKAAHPESWQATLGGWLATWWARWWTYRRGWDRVMERCGLVVQVDDEIMAPRIKRVIRGLWWDRLVLTLQVGQTVDDYREAAERLRHAWAVSRVSVREVQPAQVELSLMRSDPLRHLPISAAPMPETTAEIDWDAIWLGIDEFGDDWTIPFLQVPTTGVSGTMGAGKASFAWNVLRQLAPAIADGVVRVHAIDPKGKELRAGLPLFATHFAVREVDSEKRKFAVDLVPDEHETCSYAIEPDEVLAMLRGLVRQMEADSKAQTSRAFRPSLETPLQLIIIDELAPLYSYWPRAIVDKIMDALGLLLTQGRAVGYLVIGCIQEPTKDIFRQRDLYQRRLCLRVPTDDHVDAALADGAVKRGARAHEIHPDMPGTAYVLVDGQSEVLRVRMGHVTDEDLAALVDYVLRLRLVADVRATEAREAAESAAATPSPMSATAAEHTTERSPV
jgi:S-DNA-T family DNA segregation ATPase FtsK/SpoIIIE